MVERSSTRISDGSSDLGLVDGLVQMSFSVVAAISLVTNRYDSSITQTRLLGALRDRELSMAQIAQLLSLDKSSATGLVDRAESKGYVARTPALTDGRSIRVSLSPQGRRMANRVAREVAREIDDAAMGLSLGERRRLSRLASKFVYLEATRRGIDLTMGFREKGHAQKRRSA
jgi:DNA-binding MarR family transcriptional regulator